VSPTTVNVADVTREVEAALAAGDPDGARARAEVALASRGDDAALHVLLARARLAGGRAADAEDALRRALVINPQHAEAQRLLGAALAQRGRFGEAVEWWSRWLAHGETAGNGGDERARVSHAIKAAQELDMALRRATGG
jgi:cytochrome c-type biogenesis protein CcmH/NrfG